MARAASRKIDNFNMYSGQKARQSLKAFERRKMADMAQRAVDRDKLITRATMRALATHFTCTMAVVHKTLEPLNLPVEADAPPARKTAAKTTGKTTAKTSAKTNTKSDAAAQEAAPETAPPETKTAKTKTAAKARPKTPPKTPAKTPAKSTPAKAAPETEATPTPATPPGTASKGGQRGERGRLGVAVPKNTVLTAKREKSLLNQIAALKLEAATSKTEHDRLVAELDRRELALDKEAARLAHERAELETLVVRVDHIQELRERLHTTQRELDRARADAAAAAAQRTYRHKSGFPFRLVSLEHARDLAARWLRDADTRIDDLTAENNALRAALDELRDELDDLHNNTPLDPMAVYGNGKEEYDAEEDPFPHDDR